MSQKLSPLPCPQEEGDAGDPQKLKSQKKVFKREDKIPKLE